MSWYPLNLPKALWGWFCQNHQAITALILLGTMGVIYWQASIASKEYKARNKPVIGINSVKSTFVLEDNDQCLNKAISWDFKRRTFTCENGTPSIKGFLTNIEIKNFGTEPATNFNTEAEIIIGKKQIKDITPTLINSMIMLGQPSIYTATVSREDITMAFLNKEQVKFRYTFKYGDITMRKGLFEYSSDIVVVNENSTVPVVMNCDLKDMR
jgi:hypothetical protein